MTLLYSTCFLVCQGQTGKTRWLEELHTVMKESISFEGEKVLRIDGLYKKLGQKSGIDLFNYNLELFTEYAGYKFDSAYTYAVKLREIALAEKDESKLTYASLKMNQILLSSGMFKEVFESFDKLDPSLLDISQKAEFYSLKARSYFDLADYNGDSVYSKLYNTNAERCIDTCLGLSPPNSFTFLYYSGLKRLRTGDHESASHFFDQIENKPELIYQKEAILYSTYSDIYIRREKPDSAIILLAKAAIADIKSSNRETTAILHLATLLFKQGDLDNAVVFIQKAAYDASLYGARQRKIQLSNILPLIEAERLATVQKEKFSITRYALIITFSLLFLLTLIIIIIRQVRKLKKQQTEIQKKNISLHRLLGEKEWLLKEVHHRVKNNLHTINSLLESQSAFLHDEALTAIKDSQHRVFAMSLIHQKLYQPENNVISIDMAAYLHELVNYLKDSFETGNQLQFEMDLDTIELDISLAVPLGLILNEAITNAVKYAFPGGKKGKISIAVKKQPGNQVVFSVSDNGVGLPEGFDPGKTKSLGLKLMKGLCDDISATFRCESNEGTHIVIELQGIKYDQPTFRMLEKQ